VSDGMRSKRWGFRIDSRVKLDPEDIERFRAIGHAVYVTNGYAWISTVDTGPVAVHQIVMDRVGKHGDGLVIDHINGDRADNRKANLRVVPDLVNQINRHTLNRNNTSGHRGVAPFSKSRTKPWRATISVDRRQVHLGLFATVEEAVAARRAAELEYFGELCPVPERRPECPSTSDPT
jgi:hypothetical protein